MKIVTHTPDKYIQQYIKQIWIIEEGLATDLEVISFPVGYPFINVINGYPFTIMLGNENQITTKSYLAGQYSTPFKLNMRMIKRAITIQLQPYSVPLIFKVSGTEVANQIIPLELLSRVVAEQIEELISGKLPSLEVLKRTEELLSSKIWNNPDARLVESIQQIYIHHGEIPMKKVADSVNLSNRRLQQLYYHFLGIPAKSFSRIVKLQSHSYQALHGKSVDSIVPDGYYDQAHYIHSIKELTNMLPGDYFKYIQSPRNKSAYLSSNLYYQG